MPVTVEIPNLAAGIPKGAWVAASHDEKRVITYGSELQDVLRRAKQAGEDDPVVFRVPLTDAVAFL